MADDQRGIGRTTKQMQAAPQAAIFVWCDSSLYYPKYLARRLGRKDLRVVPASWLTASMWGTSPDTHVVIDHALWNIATPAQVAGANDAFRRFKGI